MAAPGLLLSDVHVILPKGKQMQGLEKGFRLGAVWRKTSSSSWVCTGSITQRGSSVFSEGLQSAALTLTCVFLLFGWEWEYILQMAAENLAVYCAAYAGEERWGE